MMKHLDTLLILGAAGAGLYFLSSSLKKTTSTAAPRPGGNASSLNNNGNLPTVEIANTALPGGPGWGWTYYSDGTAIGPDGAYYFQGQKVYG